MSDSVRRRLIACFQAALPDLTEDQIVSSTAKDFHSWDSIRFVNLVAAVEDEFGVELSSEIDEINSFDEMAAYVEEEAG